MSLRTSLELVSAAKVSQLEVSHGEFNINLRSLYALVPPQKWELQITSLLRPRPQPVVGIWSHRHALAVERELARRGGEKGSPSCSVLARFRNKGTVG